MIAKTTEALMDKRVVERNLKKSVVKSEDFSKYLSKLPDVTDHSERLQIVLEEGEGATRNTRKSDPGTPAS